VLVDFARRQAAQTRGVMSVRTGALGQHAAARLRHHWRSQCTPSLLPSILTPGQFFRNQVASSQERICEQYCRPSQR
jgi:hypothetical protein